MDRSKKQLRTPISYYGGKQALLHHIRPMIPAHEVYTETFFGGGSVFWDKVPAKNETINDRLDIVVNFYQVLKSNFPDLKKLIDQTLISRTQHLTAQRYLSKKHRQENPVKLEELFCRLRLNLTVSIVLIIMQNRKGNWKNYKKN